MMAAQKNNNNTGNFSVKMIDYCSRHPHCCIIYIQFLISRKINAIFFTFSRDKLMEKAVGAKLVERLHYFSVEKRTAVLK